MATYATFKHVELYNVGNTKKRVLKPPGGGSSDIFGGDNPSTPRSVKNRMASNIFAAPTQTNGTNGFAVKNGGAGDRRAKTNGNSHSRLFGEPDRQSTPAKQHMRSNIPIGGEKAAIATVSNGHDHATNGHSNGVAKTNGHHQNGGGSSSSSTNGDHVDHPRQPRVIKQSYNKQFNGNNNENTIMNGRNGFKKSCTMFNGVNVGRGGPRNNGVSNQVSPVSSMTTSTSSSSYSQPNSARSENCRRNPVTGEGCISKDMMIWTGRRTNVNGVRKCNESDSVDGQLAVGFQRPRKLISFRKENGNPVTGEGYKVEINTTVPTLNGTNQVIQKNRVPPGGFSSGLW